VRVLPPGVAVANTQFTFYNCSARLTYARISNCDLPLVQLLIAHHECCVPKWPNMNVSK